MAKAVRYKNINLARQQGELARFKVSQGPDSGALFIIIGTKLSIGRGEENDIVLLDLKSSRVHAEIFFVNGQWKVKDKGSANGILVNGKSTREAVLKLRDTLTIGGTTLEFTPSEVNTSLLLAPPQRIEEIQANQNKLNSHREKIGAMGLAALFKPIGSASLSSLKKQDKSSFVFLILAALAVVVFFLPGGDSTQSQSTKSQKSDSNQTGDLANYLPKTEFNKSAETLFRDGFREYLAGNYTRARTQFETVLQISPSHTLAQIYLNNCDKAVESEVKVNLEYGKKTFKAGKLRDAKAHFERVIRLLYRDQANPNYIEANDQVTKLKKEMSEENPS